MTGDFLALLQKNSLPLPSIAKQSPTPLEATTVFAFHCAEGVMISGDHRAMAGQTVFSDRIEKIRELDSHSLMAVAGVPTMAFEMARTLQTAFEFYRRSQLQPMTCWRSSAPFPDYCAAISPTLCKVWARFHQYLPALTPEEDQYRREATARRNINEHPGQVDENQL